MRAGPAARAEQPVVYQACRTGKATVHFLGLRAWRDANSERYGRGSPRNGLSVLIWRATYATERCGYQSAPEHLL